MLGEGAFWSFRIWSTGGGGGGWWCRRMVGAENFAALLGERSTKILAFLSGVNGSPTSISVAIVVVNL